MKAECYSDLELIRQIWDYEDIRKLMYRRVLYGANEERHKEMNELWVSDPDYRKTACFGANSGYYLGYEEVYKYYVKKRENERLKQLAEISKANPAIANVPKNLHVGCMSSRPLNTGMIEIAEDGATAKGLWFCIGHETTAQADGTATANYYTAKVGVDFVRETDGWKIWHLVIANDEGGEYGVTEMPHYGQRDISEEEFGEPTLKMVVHNKHFNWWDNFPYPPLPYKTFSDQVSYGPEGHPFRNGMRWELR